MLLKLWEQLKTLGYSSKDKDNVNVVLKVGSKSSHKLNEIVNVFNVFSLTTVAANLVEKLPPPPMYFMLPLLFANNLQKSYQWCHTGWHISYISNLLI
jgi:hypothetical protein